MSDEIDYSRITGVEQLYERMSYLDYGNDSQKEVEKVLRLSDQIKPFYNLMMRYDCALAEVRTKLEVFNKELALKNNRNPFESIKSRIKTPVSIYDKLTKKGYDFTIKNIEEQISDIAGIRAICSFEDDIYMLADCFKKQDDIVILQEKDYIANPKESGYRSLHLIVEVPIFLTEEKYFMKVEVQFRTIAMDFWASLEHKMKYKKDIENADTITEDLKFSADLINQLDRRMQQIRQKIDASDSNDSQITPWLQHSDEDIIVQKETKEKIIDEIEKHNKSKNASNKKAKAIENNDDIKIAKPRRTAIK
jgi:putative GTP pyrophosphokinase